MAMNAYSRSMNIAQGAKGAGETDSSGEAGSAGGVTFSDFLRQKASQSVETMRKSEEMSAKAVTGEADLTDVVQAVTAAELTLQTVVSVRDRMISAYQEIMRMPI
ncbi:MAG: flagellar hook-basal body complex protein FliE [Rhodospirillales bacterium]|nr:flagellar hook-basal body complex protein FliE [Rhodospirillales bacterium]